jgi:PAS domain-containing protein
MKAVADDYLVKPFSERELLSRIGAHLELARVRMEAAAENRRREAQFSALINQAPIGIVLLDAELRFQLVNPTALPVFEVTDPVDGDFSQVHDVGV